MVPGHRPLLLLPEEWVHLQKAGKTPSFLAKIGSAALKQLAQGRGRSCHAACATTLPGSVRLILVWQFSPVTLRSGPLPSRPPRLVATRIKKKPLKIEAAKSSGRKNPGEGKKERKGFLFGQELARCTETLEGGLFP